ncbi:hypothetical protein PENSPDRAFT_670744, partial [Peniophora sp. CONT]
LLEDVAAKVQHRRNAWAGGVWERVKRAQQRRHRLGPYSTACTVRHEVRGDRAKLRDHSVWNIADTTSPSGRPKKIEILKGGMRSQYARQNFSGAEVPLNGISVSGPFVLGCLLHPYSRATRRENSTLCHRRLFSSPLSSSSCRITKEFTLISPVHLGTCFLGAFDGFSSSGPATERTSLRTLTAYPGWSVKSLAALPMRLREGTIQTVLAGFRRASGGAERYRSSSTLRIAQLDRQASARGSTVPTHSTSMEPATLTRHFTLTRLSILLALLAAVVALYLFHEPYVQPTSSLNTAIYKLQLDGDAKASLNAFVDRLENLLIRQKAADARTERTVERALRTADRVLAIPSNVGKLVTAVSPCTSRSELFHLKDACLQCYPPERGLAEHSMLLSCYQTVKRHHLNDISRASPSRRKSQVVNLNSRARGQYRQNPFENSTTSQQSRCQRYIPFTHTYRHCTPGLSSSASRSPFEIARKLVTAFVVRAWGITYALTRAVSSSVSFSHNAMRWQRETSVYDLLSRSRVQVDDLNNRTCATATSPKFIKNARYRHENTTLPNSLLSATPYIPMLSHACPSSLPHVQALNSDMKLRSETRQSLKKGTVVCHSTQLAESFNRVCRGSSDSRSAVLALAVELQDVSNSTGALRHLIAGCVNMRTLKLFSSGRTRQRPNALLPVLQFANLTSFTTNLPHCQLRDFLSHQPQLESLFLLGSCSSSGKCALRDTPLHRLKELHCVQPSCINLLSHSVSVSELVVCTPAIEGASDYMPREATPMSSAIRTLRLPFSGTDVPALVSNIVRVAPRVEVLSLQEYRGAFHMEHMPFAINRHTFATDLRRLGWLSSLSLKLLRRVGLPADEEDAAAERWIAQCEYHPSLRLVQVSSESEGALGGGDGAARIRVWKRKGPGAWNKVEDRS